MRKELIPAAGALFLLLLFVFSAGGAAAEEGEGYDENTEVTVRGAVTDVLQGRRGPVRLRLASAGRIYYIVTAPSWYLRRREISFQEGAALEVTGSKYIGEEGRIFVIARRIRDEKTGQELFFRDPLCRPMWHGKRPPGTER